MKAEEIRLEYRRLIEEHPEENRAGALAVRDNEERSDLYFRDRFTSKTLQIPRLYTEDMIAQFREIVRTTYGICDKVIREYLRNPEYRELFGFSRELEELILLERGYDSVLPIARFDIFYHEDTGDFQFCEINTDGSSGMNEDRLLDTFMLHNPAHQEMRRRYSMKTMELFDSWVRSFLSLYQTWPGHVARPNVVITDFLDTGTLREFEEFARRFQRAGAECEICDIRDFRFSGGKLYTGTGHVVDAVYRRAVTADIMSAGESVRPFLTAVREGAFFLAGSFCTQIPHHKSFFYLLRHDRTRELLTPEENEFVEKHIPVTVPFTAEFLSPEEVIREKDRYILKPEDSYASQGVYAGVEKDRETWEGLVKEAFERGYICQEYCPQYSAENIDYAWGDGEWHPYIEMAGLYSYNGVFAGVFARAAEGNGIIASHRNERTQPTYIVGPKDIRARG